ncbi:MAG: hypothetical protein JRM73_03950 [Nitrososphaerota archaeon]|nr:hypothetical protein [Nitrososphaerota archaeon]
MKPRAELVISCGDAEAVRALMSVLAPDNEGGPRGLGITASAKGDDLVIQVAADSPTTLVSTCLAFLRDVSLFREVWLLSRTGQG